VKRKNLENLLYPLGIPDSHLNTTWLAQMDSFGQKRGVWAHNAAGVQQAPDPLTELTEVGRILIGLLDLDRILSALQ
jgi:hypothetical protein